MEPLARVTASLAQQPGSISGLDRQTEETVINAVAAMHSSLNAYGKKWGAVVGQGWLMALRVAHDITAEDMVLACGHWLANEKDFPTPAEVFGWIRIQREDVAKAEWLRAESERFEREDQAERDARNVELFGHAKPTREEWCALLGEKFVESMLGLDSGPSKTLPRERQPDTPEAIAAADAKRRLIREQASLGTSTLGGQG